MKRLTRIQHLATCAFLTAVVVGSTPSFAYRMIKNTSTGRVTAGSLVTCTHGGGFTHWTQKRTDWYHNTALKGAGKTQALKNSMAAWTNVSSANHVLRYKATTGAGWATDGKNTLLWAVGNGCGSGCLALTALVLQSGQRIVESDVTFNNNYNWTTNGGNYDTQTVATHELGHALGIHHSEVGGSPPPTMRANYFGSAGRSLESDDKYALQCSQARYPVGGVVPPPVQVSLTVTSEYCYGYVTLAWSSLPYVTRYELYKSRYSNYSGQTRVYNGSATSKFLNAGTGTWYFRVRACNSAGCGAYRNGNRSFTSISGCCTKCHSS